jgi:hypothetical protein
MPKAIIHIQRLAVHSRAFGGDDRQLVSRVYFSLIVQGTPNPGLHADVRQMAPGGPEVPVEVGPPVGYSGPFNREAFSKVIERYYRNVIGTALGSSPVPPQKVRDGVFISKATAQFGLPEPSGG